MLSQEIHHNSTMKASFLLAAGLCGVTVTQAFVFNPAGKRVKWRPLHDVAVAVAPRVEMPFLSVVRLLRGGDAAPATS